MGYLMPNPLYTCHHHRVVPLTWISLTLSRHSSLSFITFGQSFRLHPVSVQDKSLAGRPTLARPCEGVQKRTLLVSSSLLLPQCPACLVRLIWMILNIRRKWPYNCYFVGCCFQDFFITTRSILVQLPSSLFLIRVVSVHVVHPRCSMDTTAVWKKLRLILSDRSDIHMTDSLSIAVHTFARRVLMSVSVDETLLLR